MKPSTEDILGNAIQPSDKALDFIVSDNYYQWYYKIGVLKRPQTIVEFGVRYGYSSIALCRGANLVHVRPSLFLWDSEQDIPGCLEIAAANILPYASGIRVFKEDTKHARKLPGVLADIVHVDADHSDEGLRAELALADNMVWRDGWILVDDTNAKSIRDITEDFAASRGYSVLRIPTLRGMIIIKPDPFS